MSRSLRRAFSFRKVFISFLFLCHCGAAWAIPANPQPFWEAQGDGTRVLLRAHGDEHFSWLEDADGYTVVRNNGWLHYAERGANGRLQAGPYRVGLDNPRALGLQKRVMPTAAARAAGARTTSTSQAVGLEAVSTSGTLKNLVVMIRFSDHATRALPPVGDYDILFNATGGHPSIAPTGSIKDAYLEMSYGQLTIDSTLSGWINVSNTEAYYANNNGGDSTLWQALNQALDVLDASIDFGDFDQDNDGYIDSIAFIHSGYGAEWGGVLTRIWSHKWAIQNPPGGWVSDDQNALGQNVRVFNYHISTGLWGTSGTNIGRIGVIAHETGHYLGLPDLYDTDSGAGDGIGSWGLMANSWGFDFEQYCPGHMSAWSKQNLGWVTPTVLTDPGSYVIDRAETAAQSYRINAGYPSGEYLLLENRQPFGLDCSMPQGGLLVFHIDDTAGYNTQGYPGQAGWPGNGNHYRVALLQADGNYHLEKGNNRGDAGDPHHGAGVDAIGPYSLSGYPNTDAYRNGNVYETGNLIYEISNSGASMTFCYNSCVGLTAPSGLAANATGSSSIALSWTDNSADEDGFRLEHSTNGSTWALEANLGANATSYNDSGLAPGSIHYYRVRAFAGSDVSGWSNTASATTDQVPPAAPSGLVATGVSQSRIDLAWTDNANNESSYRVDVSTNGTSFSTLATLGANATSYGHTGLTAGVTRHYRVYAVNSAGSVVSNTATGSTLPPPPIQDFVADSESHASGSVSGNHTATHADDGSEQQLTEQQNNGKPSNRTSYLEHAWHFDIASGDEVQLHARARRSNNSDGDNFQFAWSTNGTSYTNAFVVNSASETGYQAVLPNSVSGGVWVRVVDTDRSQGNSSQDSLWVDHLYLRVINDGPPTAPAAPTALGAVAAGPTSINLSWTDNAGNEDGFRIERSPNGSSGWAQVGSVGGNVTSWGDSGLAPATPYWYRVYAFNGVGNSANSNVASATTDADPPPPADPTGLAATATGSDSIDLAWTDQAGNETGYTVQRSANGVDFSTVATLGANAQAWSDSGLSPATQYWYRVRAFHATKQSNWSNTASATTDSGPPPPAITLSVNAYKNKGSKNYDLTWSGAAGTSVDVYRDGVLRFGTANDGAHSYDSGEKGGGSHTHRVCEQGSTTACSNIVTSTF